MGQRVFSGQEEAVFALRSLYERYDYRRYKMNKFEEYDLYAGNKEFLLSSSVLTFTDTDGKLMALKPDVTLSIIKNTKPTGVHKVYYDENVYRVGKGAQGFRELRQTGAECLGEIDEYLLFETVSLAVRSLKTIADLYGRRCEFVLSDLSLLSGLAEYAGFSKGAEKEFFAAVGEKNPHALCDLCEREGVEIKKRELLLSLVSTYGNAEAVLCALSSFAVNARAKEGAEKLGRLASLLREFSPEEALSIDFSVVGDTGYYSGAVFKGYIEGIPVAVLSGGEYAALMQKTGRRGSAVGFAVYLDELEYLQEERREYDVDTVILYEESCPVAAVARTAEKYLSQGSVSAVRRLPEGQTFRRVVRLNGKGEEV